MGCEHSPDDCGRRRRGGIEDKALVWLLFTPQLSPEGPHMLWCRW